MSLHISKPYKKTFTIFTVTPGYQQGISSKEVN